MTRTADPSPADAVTPEQAARFAAALDRLLPQGGRPGLAVSGGPDSLAMLLLAQAAIPGGFEVATVDHGLRPEAQEEAAFVAATCAAIGVPCEVLEVDVGPGNKQQSARLARYAVLTGWAERRGLAAIVTAHHADDQAETLLMRLNRGSGVAGLAGVRERGFAPGGEMPLVRPLLEWRRAELAGIVAQAGLVPVDDPSNLDPRFDRARLRVELAGADWLDPAAIARSAAHLAEADEVLQWLTDAEWDACVAIDAGGLRYRPSVPRAVVLRVVERIIGGFGGRPRGGDVARLVDELYAGRGGNVGGVQARCEEGEWVFRPEPARRA